MEEIDCTETIEENNSQNKKRNYNSLVAENNTNDVCASKKNKSFPGYRPFLKVRIENAYTVNQQRRDEYIKYMNSLLTENTENVEVAMWWIDVLSKSTAPISKDIICSLEVEVTKYSSIHCSLILSKLYRDNRLVSQKEEYLSLKHLLFCVNKVGVKNHSLCYYIAEIKYFSNDSGVGNIEEALTFYEKAISLGNIPSLFKLGKHLLSNRQKCVPSFWKAIQLLEKAAGFSDERAILQMARIYRGADVRARIFIDCNFEKSVDYYLKIKESNIVALKELGLLYIGLYGEGGWTEPNKNLEVLKREGLKVLNEACERGCLETKIVLADVYKNGSHGFDKDVYKSIEILRKLLEDYQAKINENVLPKIMENVKKAREMLYSIYKEKEIEKDPFLDIDIVYKFYRDCYTNHSEEFKATDKKYLFRRLRDIFSDGRIEWSPDIHCAWLYKPTARKIAICLFIGIKRRNKSNVLVLNKVVVMRILKYLFSMEIDERIFGKRKEKKKVK